jgi:hypothetical protein
MDRDLRYVSGDHGPIMVVKPAYHEMPGATYQYSVP